MAAPTAQRQAKPRTERATAQAEKVEVELTADQVKTVTIAPVGQARFDISRKAVGNMDFNQNTLVQVFTPYQGRVISANVNLGDRVERGQILFTVDSPDLLQASSALIAAAGVLNLQNRTLKRVNDNLRGGGGAQKDVDQAISDQQTAEGALRAARDVMRIYGKTDEEVDRIVTERRADSTLMVRSPLAGYVTARNAAPGLLLQPGNAPAPITLADAKSMWMIANVPEADSALLQVGQQVQARVSALPGKTFDGTISVVGATVDPQTRRTMVRSEIADPDHALRAGMFADFTIRIGAPIETLAVPANAIVREGDGTMTVWLTTDRLRFEKRNVKIGLRQNGFVQILEGVRPGDLVVTDGALFLTNKLVGGPSD
ncbi:MAG: efflux transporter periplasmic adaptor subunit [Alphaproteobacteria bacterium 65-37]|nr:MAG: efflux transporter periplasmic adaptor subunit [Alphaproteobacteria bacterium 65-37]